MGESSPPMARHVFAFDIAISNLLRMPMDSGDLLIFLIDGYKIQSFLSWWVIVQYMHTNELQYYIALCFRNYYCKNN